MAVAEALLYHRYPKFFWKYPRLVRVIYLWNYLITKRASCVKAGLRQRLKAKTPLSVLEIGFGEGMYLSWAKRNFPQHRFFGIDRNLDNVRFVSHLCPNIDLLHADIETYNFENQQYDLILMVGVLHYLKNDVAVLEKTQKALKPKGLLHLYTPIEGRIVCKKLSQSYRKKKNYDEEQGLQRIYKQIEIKELLRSCDLEPQSQIPTYGTAATAAREWYLFCLGHIAEGKLWAYLALGLSWWVVALLMVLDKGNPPNGLWIEAVKKS